MSPTTGYRSRELPKDRRELAVAVPGRAAFDDRAVIVAAARAGIGLAQVFEDEVWDDLAASALIPVLADLCPPFPSLYLYRPRRRQVRSPLAAFVSFARADRERTG